MTSGNAAVSGAAISGAAVAGATIAVNEVCKRYRTVVAVHAVPVHVQPGSTQLLVPHGTC